MKFSTSDWTMLRIRAIPCIHCGARISLSTPINKILIAETVASCDRVGEILIKELALDGRLVTLG